MRGKLVSHMKLWQTDLVGPTANIETQEGRYVQI